MVPEFRSGCALRCCAVGVAAAAVSAVTVRRIRQTRSVPVTGYRPVAVFDTCRPDPFRRLRSAGRPAGLGHVPSPGTDGIEFAETGGPGPGRRYDAAAWKSLHRRAARPPPPCWTSAVHSTLLRHRSACVRSRQTELVHEQAVIDPQRSGEMRSARRSSGQQLVTGRLAVRSGRGRRMCDPTALAAAGGCCQCRFIKLGIRDNPSAPLLSQVVRHRLSIHPVIALTGNSPLTLIEFLTCVVCWDGRPLDAAGV